MPDAIIGFFSRRQANPNLPGTLFFALILLFIFHINIHAAEESMAIKLPQPDLRGERSFPQLLNSRYSCRDFSQRRLSLEEISALLWAASGRSADAVTSATRTVPSAGATYPLEIYLVVGKESVKDLKEGFYRYDIQTHCLQPLVRGQDMRRQLSAACLGQDFIKQAAVSLIIAAEFKRTTGKYGQRGVGYVYMEAGHSCQNVYLMAANLGLGTVEVGALNDQDLKALLSLDVEPIAVMPVGYAR